MFKNALVSVSDKTHLAPFLKNFPDLRIVSTGGTAKYLKENGFSITEVGEQTGFPEVMDGRVRTLHPYIHMPLLARLENSADVDLLKQNKLEPFDLVIGNLYPFEEYMNKDIPERELTEYIDIGGPALLRAAAKNYHQIAVICDPSDYGTILEKKELNLDDRKRLASKVFAHISLYDSMIAKKLNSEFHKTEIQVFGGKKKGNLRYGENPLQEGVWIESEKRGLHQAQFLHGKELSYNNILDLDAAVDVLTLFENQNACIAIKHNNPCGVGAGESLLESTIKCLRADPLSVFGGVVALNKNVDQEVARELNNIFLECIIAPSFDPLAFEILSTKKNLRILKLDFKDLKKKYHVRSILGGYLLQTADQISNEFQSDWKLHGEVPSYKIKRDLLFAWKVCASLKSNAIAICENEQTLGLGMGQVSRVDSVEQAILRLKKFHPGYNIPVLASDAFFPFADSVELAHHSGIRWIIQPGGSVKDNEVIEKAKLLGVNLVLTGRRHFKH